MKTCLKNTGQNTLLGGPALLSAFIWQISIPPRRDLGSQ